MPPLRSFVMAAALSSGLAACAPDVVFIETPPAILVEPVQVEFGGRARYMSFADKRRLRGSLNDLSGGRIDAVHLAIFGPRGRASAIGRAAHAAGVETSKIRLYPASRVSVKARLYRAYPPVCPDLNVYGPPVEDNDFEPTLGCSDLANLATMVNDPADLIGSRAAPLADGERAALNARRYRQGSGASGAPTGGTSGSQSGQDKPSSPTTSTGGAGR